MISPQELNSINQETIDKIINEIDTEMKETHGWYPWEEAVITGEYPDEVMNAICKLYYEVGWTYIYWDKSSEQGERPGLSGFKFSTTPIDETYVKEMHQYSPI